MNKNEIIDNLVRTGANEFEISIPCKFFASSIKIVIFSGDSDANNIVISDYLVDCIGDINEYGIEEKPKIVKDIFGDYENAIKSTNYGMVSTELVNRHNGNIELANKEYFRIISEDDAFRALTFNYAMVVEYSRKSKIGYKPRYFGLFFERPWDTEHELQLEFEDGKYKQLL
jgi:hypothetical protein